MATAAAIVIAEVEEIVEIGEIDPNQVHTPSIFVNFLVKTELLDYQGKTMEYIANKEIIAKRIARIFKTGEIVNLAS